MKYQFTFRGLVLAQKQNLTLLFQINNYPPNGITLQKIHFGKAKRLPIPNINVTKKHLQSSVFFAFPLFAPKVWKVCISAFSPFQELDNSRNISSESEVDGWEMTLCLFQKGTEHFEIPCCYISSFLATTSMPSPQKSKNTNTHSKLSIYKSLQQGQQQASNSIIITCKVF